MRSLIGFFLFIVVTVGVTACLETELQYSGDTLCIEGQEQSCPCVDGTYGTQACREDLSGWKECICTKYGKDCPDGQECITIGPSGRYYVCLTAEHHAIPDGLKDCGDEEDCEKGFTCQKNGDASKKLCFQLCDNQEDGDTDSIEAMDGEIECSPDQWVCLNENTAILCDQHGSNYVEIDNCKSNEECINGTCEEINPDGDVEFESDSDVDTENGYEPLLCAGGICTDPSTGFEWQETPSGGAMNWSGAIEHCQNLGKGWRLPNISELRTLVRHCPSIETDGLCGVKDTCLPCDISSDDACLEIECLNDECNPSECHADNGGPTGCHWPEQLDGTCLYYWSYSTNTDNSSFAWSLNHMRGYISKNSKSNTLYARCIRTSAIADGDSDDEADMDSPETWTDPTTELVWQYQPSENTLTNTGAINYCNNLVLGGHDNWLLPTISELRSLVRGCETSVIGGSCGVTDDCTQLSCRGDTCGKCSVGEGPDNGCYKPGEIKGTCGRYWSSSQLADFELHHWTINFGDGIVNYAFDDNAGSYVRCVLNGEVITDGDTDGACSGACNEHGTCKDGICECFMEFAGAQCNSCFSEAIGSYPYCFLPSTEFCLTSQCFNVPPSGQTACFDNSTTVNCPDNAGSNECGAIEFCGQDAQYADPERTFTCYSRTGTATDCSLLIPVEDDEVVVDSLTGMMWQRRITSQVNWQSASDACSNLVWGGYSDWRLPSPLELLSIVDDGAFNPAIDNIAFRGTAANYYWTSATHQTYSDQARYVDFSYGYISYFRKTQGTYYRCVRAGFIGSDEGTFAPYVVSGEREQTVVHKTTGLIWQKSYTSDKTWEDALAYCESLNYAGHSDWKLPDKKELASLMNYEVINPCSDFPNMPSVSFWSSTSHMLEPEKAWVVGFSGGDVYMRSKADLYHVRCVTGNR